MAYLQIELETDTPGVGRGILLDSIAKFAEDHGFDVIKSSTTDRENEYVCCIHGVPDELINLTKMIEEKLNE